MKTRIVHTKFWEDSKVTKMSYPTRYLFLYLFTNSRIGQIGIYEISDRIILFDTSLSSTQLTSAKKELEYLEVVRFYDDWVYVVNSQKHGGYSGEKNEKARITELQKIPESVANYFRNLGHQIPYGYPIDSSINQKSETIAYKTEIEDQNEARPRMMTREETDEMVEWALKSV